MTTAAVIGCKIVLTYLLSLNPKSSSRYRKNTNESSHGRILPPLDGGDHRSRRLLDFQDCPQTLMHPHELATPTHLISFLHPPNFSSEKGIGPFGWPRITPSWRKFGSRGEHRHCGIAWRASQETLGGAPETRCGGGQHAQDMQFPQRWLKLSNDQNIEHRAIVTPHHSQQHRWCCLSRNRTLSLSN